MPPARSVGRAGVAGLPLTDVLLWNFPEVFYATVVWIKGLDPNNVFRTILVRTI